ncbi:hypothetical protein DYB28_007548 [Aphanomyces astaci]|uniref:Myb/SANT-like DNA-binding domain-containing protein n=1 Tax=Aphanomyces astaci TaxID=112090 RepID=A0A397FII0_APHAT|nr:hypothetical protein AaE_011006 [Aphanomyces astaci]RHY21460.1 hypothetical protein DYB25_006234 [Aphanomyces astaci]RHY35910.1 hypothetical protein DYB38_008586 [Aphanomyces astaci]RHY66593.1 hypothetical protein DYB34_002095 [Aphanomyces astaci]RHZ33239.1 hypothetical protein DYB31_007321 [Aphanomyces astaci]
MALAKGKSKTPTKRDLIERLAQLEAGSGALDLRSPDKQVTTQDKKTVWSVDMIQVLLELRLRAYASPFQGSKSNQQLSVLWEKIAMRLSVVSGVVVSHPSAKAKYHSLKQEYSRIRVSEQQTGNNVDEAATNPPYWEHMVEYFGDNSGLGHNEFGSSTERAIDTESDRAEEEFGDVEASVDTTRPSKRSKPSSASAASVASGLVTLGETLAKGLVDAASVGTSSATNQKLDALSESIEES